MRLEWRWGLVSASAVALGALGAERYAGFTAPFFSAATTAIAAAHPWTVRGVEVARDAAGSGAVLRLSGEVRRPGESMPAARISSSVAVGEVIDAPLIFWTLVLLWPARDLRQRLMRVALGIPVFLGLEILTTACQLLHPLAEASAILAGDDAPVTLWERWSRFLEAGGRFVLEVSAALCTVAMAQKSPRAHARSASL
jgi:hypothetical protein